jgi:hypothetical protein
MATYLSRCLRAQINTPAIASAVVIAKYDPVVLSSGAVYPVGYDANADGTGNFWDTDEATTMGAAHDTFLGIAMEQSRSGDIKSIVVATDIELQVEMTSATYTIGGNVAAQKAAGNNLVAQKYKAAASAAISLGRIVETTAASAVKAWVRFRGTITEDGVMTPTT